ncbi:aminodeoxychorismate/anthranilate synthase component II, partial [Streptomyces yangpuensis]|uniref:aminodeoxychorismate/anthranilate synthase component II n=1 Tax=Streptomyces yangpuensis TaxID=1648182 RepID=UPI0035DAF2E7
PRWVRHSEPGGLVGETHATAGGGRAALGGRPAAPRPPAGGARLADDPRVRAALAARRAGLAPFWLRMQERPAAATGRALVVDGEDTFTAMLAHVLRVAGAEVTVRRFDEPGLREAALAWEGPIVLGPGPGDPADSADPKMRLLRGLAAELLAGHRHGLLGVCLGHELLAAELGLPLVRKAEPAQGAQTRIALFGAEEVVGFYNTYAAHCDDAGAARLARAGVEVSRDPVTGEVHALRSAGGGFAGVQFHPESVLTLRGPDLLRDLLTAVLTPAPA